LAIVAAVLAADGVFGAGELAGTVLLGEPGLDGAWPGSQGEVILPDDHGT